jgi:hypothetical protein
MAHANEALPQQLAHAGDDLGAERLHDLHEPFGDHRVPCRSAGRKLFCNFLRRLVQVVIFE